MRLIFVRLGFMYNTLRLMTMAMAIGAVGAFVFYKVTGGVLKDFLGAASTKLLKADLVANVVVKALEDDLVKGLIKTKEIEELALKA